MAANHIQTKLLTVAAPGVMIAGAPLLIVGMTMMLAPSAEPLGAQPAVEAVATSVRCGSPDPAESTTEGLQSLGGRPAVSACTGSGDPRTAQNSEPPQPPSTEYVSRSGDSRAGGNPGDAATALDSRLRGNDGIPPRPPVDPPPPPPVLPPIDDDDDPVKSGEDPKPAARPSPPLPNSNWTPEQLQQSLLRVPEVWLQPPEYAAIPKLGRATFRSHPIFAVIEARPDLQGLPMRRDASVWLPDPESDAFRDASVIIRKSLAELAGQGPSRNRRIVVQPQVLSARPEVVARVMHQMLQIESAPLRQAMLIQLKKIKAPATTRALAHQAVYEPMAELRKIAVTALAARSATDYMPVLLEAFRSPWSPAADHAADALTALAPPEAATELVKFLEATESTAPPVNKKGEPVVQELVRINHARNCLLCHAQSVDPRDGIRVAVPSRYRPLPAPFSLDGYEGGGRGGSRTGSNTVFTRPDVTYMKQDFSWILPVSNSGPWPYLQRYDFVVRTRPMQAGDVSTSDSVVQQRKSIVRALRAVTGKDLGDRAADWRTSLTVAANRD